MNAATLVIDPVAEDADRILSACPDGALIGDLRSAESWNDPDGTLVVVAGPSLPLESALATAERLRSLSPRCGMVLVRQRLDTALLLAALRAGVREVVAERDLSELTDAVSRTRGQCARLRADDTAPARPATITTVFSAKGGVGKTTVATNLAVHLALRQERVCLIDLDLAFGDVSVALNIFPTHSISEAASSSTAPDGPLIAGLLAEHASGLRVLAAPSDPASAEKVTADIVGQVIDAVSGLVDHVVIDTPPALDDVVLAAIDRSDLVLLVATLDVAALKNVRLAIETLTVIGVPPERQQLVLNRADALAGVSATDVPAALGREVALTIPSSRDVPAAVNAGLTLIESLPGHPATRALAEFADASIPRRTPAASPTRPAAASPRSRGLLRRAVSAR